MKLSLFQIALAAGILCLTSFPAPAATSNVFQCSTNSLIYVGDKLATAMMKCDPPTSATKISRPKGFVGYYDMKYYEAYEVEEWLYDRGPTSFVTHLTFTNGVLTAIEIGEYGR
jgi:hypothetical protein